jgi:hypothetical protein
MGRQPSVRSAVVNEARGRSDQCRRLLDAQELTWTVRAALG